VHEVKDGNRTLQFSGKLLAESSSWRSGSFRWIEFKLYKTDNGSYILSRIGVSLVFHASTCPLVKRYGLIEASSSVLSKSAEPCEECYPAFDMPLIFPEKYRYWAQVSEEPGPVIEALYKFDAAGARYLTHVARSLLEDASKADVGLDRMYKVEHIA
jgi:hypothetical protein